MKVLYFTLYHPARQIGYRLFEVLVSPQGSFSAKVSGLHPEAAFLPELFSGLGFPVVSLYIHKYSLERFMRA